MTIRTASLGAASLLAAAVLAGPALADGMSSRGRIADAPAPRGCTTTGNVGLTTDYVFRGISQNHEEPALQGGVDFTCGQFYVGVWGSSVYGEEAAGVSHGTLELDLYAGIKMGTGPVNWDVGLIYYYYPGPHGSFDNIELKLGASGDIWKGGTLGGTAFYSPEFDYVVLEGTFAQALPKVGMFTPTFSATFGNMDTDGGADYTYWNLGLTVGFLERWSLDVRYWDTDIDSGSDCPGPGTARCDDRFVGTVKYTF